MAGQIRNNAESKGLYKPDIYEEFVHWFALPRYEKIGLDMLDQTAFAEKYGVNKDTLTRWKQRPDFNAKVGRYKSNWGDEKTPDIIAAIYRSAMQGKVSSQRLWMQHFGDNQPGQKPPEQLPLVHEDDIRFHISTLPKDLQDKYNPLMHKLLLDIVFDAKAYEEGRLDDMSNSPNYDGL